jgi:hypothetical protein
LGGVAFSAEAAHLGKIAAEHSKKGNQNMQQRIIPNVRMGLFGSTFLAMVVLAATGCTSTFKEVNTLAVSPAPKEKPAVLALGEVKITDPRFSGSEQTLMLHAFQLGVEEWCAKNKSFEVQPQSALTNGPANAIVLSGNITEIEKGSAAARFWVGMGAGQARVRGEFALHAGDGAQLASFKARSSYLGGNGIGGWDMMKIQDVVGRLGEVVAEMSYKWSQGQKLE